MTREQKIRELKKYPYLSIQLQGLIDDYNELFTSATKITQSYTDTPCVHDNESKIEKNAVKLAALSRKIEHIKNQQSEIDKALSKVRPYHRFLLTKIDINGESVGKLARSIKRDKSSVYRTHLKALDSLEL